MYGNNDWRDYSLAHGWGWSPKQKAAEKKYNAEYYQRNKEKWRKYRKNTKEWVKDKVGYDEKERRDNARKEWQDAKFDESSRERLVKNMENEIPNTINPHTGRMERDPNIARETGKLNAAIETRRQKEAVYARAENEFRRTLLGKKEITEATLKKAWSSIRDILEDLDPR